MVGISIALVVESFAVHALVYRRWPLIDVVLAAANGFTIWWLARNYRATGATPLVVGDQDLWIRHGTAISARLPWQNVREVKLATFRDQPAQGTRGFLKLSGGDDPSVLVTCEPPVDVALPLGLHRRVGLVGLRPDDAKGLVEAARRHVGEPTDQSPHA